MAYKSQFKKPYENGYEDRPSTATPVTAKIMDSYDKAIGIIEDYLENGASGDFMTKENPSGTGSIYMNIVRGSTPGKQSATFGGGNNNTAEYALVGGSANNVSGNSSIVGGVGNNVSGNSSIVGGAGNNVNGGINIVGGTDNIISGQGNVVGGASNHVVTQLSLIAGQGNSTTDTSTDHNNSMNYIIGSGNEIKTENTPVLFSFLHGTALLVKKMWTFVFGKYNEPKTDTIVEIGYGESTSERKNVFEIKTDGTVVSESGYKLSDGTIMATQDYVDAKILEILREKGLISD